MPSTTSAPTSPLQFTLPDLLAKFPWPRNLSEHFCEAKAESSAWTESYHPFDEEGLKGFNLCDFSKWKSLDSFTITILNDNLFTDLLAALSYSPREKGK